MSSSSSSSSRKTSSNLTTRAAVLAMLAGLANAAIVPNYPYGGVTLNAGQPCKIQWGLDTTGTWKNVSIQFMTGDNLQMVPITTVATGLDGTTGEGSFTWTCPTVDPPAPIYFYQFTNNGQDPTWVTRFTIATASGQTSPAPNPTQPDGAAIPWGVGKIVGGNNNGGGSVSSPSSSRVSVPTPATSSSAAIVSRSIASVTVVTVTPSLTSTSGVSRVSSGLNNNGVNSASATTNPNAASRTQGSATAAAGLVLALVAGYVFA